MSLPQHLSYVSSTLKGASETLTPKQRHIARDMFDHYRTQWMRLIPEAPENVAHTVQATVDDQTREMLATSKHGADVKCRKGCSACCHLSIDIFPQEAVLLWKWAEYIGLPIDQARLERQAAATGLDAWGQLPPAGTRCVFLGDDGACQVYEHRPSSCRKYFVKTDPDLCDMHKHPGAEVGIVFSFEAEIIHSAALTAFGSGPMAQMLLQHQPSPKVDP